MSTGDEIRYPPAELVVDPVPWWMYVLWFVWTLGAVGGIWYLIERIADA